MLYGGYQHKVNACPLQIFLTQQEKRTYTIFFLMQICATDFPSICRAGVYVSTISLFRQKCDK